MLKRAYGTAQLLEVYPNRDTRRRTKLAASRFTYEMKPGFLYSRVRAISARVNYNFDGFPSEELRKAYRTFVGRPLFVNHANHDYKRARGVIVDAAYRENGSDKFIELLAEVDPKTFPRLASALENGDIDAVSMGTDVTYSLCSYCGNKATDVHEFCEHVLYAKGSTIPKRQPDGSSKDILVYEECRGLNFFELSFVFDPADGTALLQEVIMPKTARRIRRRGYGETVAPAAVDTLREETICPECGDDTFDDVKCMYCGFVTPPEELQDPDVDKAREVDIRQDRQDQTDEPVSNVDEADKAEPNTTPTTPSSQQGPTERPKGMPPKGRQKSLILPGKGSSRVRKEGGMRTKTRQQRQRDLQMALARRRLSKARALLSVDNKTDDDLMLNRNKSDEPATETTDEARQPQNNQAVQNLDQSAPIKPVPVDSVTRNNGVTNQVAAARRRVWLAQRRLRAAEEAESESKVNKDSDSYKKGKSDAAAGKDKNPDGDADYKAGYSAGKPAAKKDDSGSKDSGGDNPFASKGRRHRGTGLYTEVPGQGSDPGERSPTDDEQDPPPGVAKPPEQGQPGGGYIRDNNGIQSRRRMRYRGTGLYTEVPNQGSDPGEEDPTADEQQQSQSPPKQGQPGGGYIRDNNGIQSRRRRRVRATGDQRNDQAVEVDVEAPVKDVNTAPGEQSQYDGSEYDNNAGGHPPLREDDPLIMLPGGGKLHSNKTGAVDAMRLAEAYIALGMIAQAEKYAYVARFEKLPAHITKDRISLLSRVAQSTQKTASARPRGVVPRFAGARRAQSPAMSSRVASVDLDSVSDSLTFL